MHLHGPLPCNPNASHLVLVLAPVALAAFSHFVVHLHMQSVKQGTDEQVLQPDHTCRPDQETSAKACKPKASQLGYQNKDKIEPEAHLDASLVFAFTLVPVVVVVAAAAAVAISSGATDGCGSE